MHARSGVSPRYFSGLTLTKMRILSLAKFLVIFIKDNEDIKISFKNHKTFNIKIYDLLHSWLFVKTFIQKPI